jgi:pimeloyl-ACP methyl ester carboxylesterase/DNA-binding winged helix-turn-helix (wHTH) protein
LIIARFDPVEGAKAMPFRFGDHTLDAETRELRHGTEPVAGDTLGLDELVYQIRAGDRVVTKDDLIASVWGGRIVSDSTLTSRINAARKAVGDNGERQRVIRTVARKGLRFVSPVEDGAVPAAPPRAAAAAAKPLRQQIHFCTAPDAARIAYAEIGQGPPVVRTGHWLTHLEYDWESPVWRPFLERAAAEHRLVRYDKRGNGLSDWDVSDFSLDAFVQDLEAVVDAGGLDRFALLGMSQGCAISVAYAVRHPERISHLVLYGGFARGLRRRGDAGLVEQSDALLTLMRHGWGQENPAFRQIFTTRFVPGGTPAQWDWFNDLQRITTSAENAVRIRRAADEFDVTALLGQIRVPTLVMHCREDAAIPFEEGRRLAAAIPGAHFVALEGRNHVILEGDPAWDRLFEEIAAFLGR